jgi:hypothetical protein
MFWSSTPRIKHSALPSTELLTQPLSQASESTNAGIWTLIEYLAEHRILICTQGKVAVSSNDLVIH